MRVFEKLNTPKAVLVMVVLVFVINGLLFYFSPFRSYEPSNWQPPDRETSAPNQESLGVRTVSWQPPAQETPASNWQPLNPETPSFGTFSWQPPHPEAPYYDMLETWEAPYYDMLETWETPYYDMLEMWEAPHDYDVLETWEPLDGQQLLAYCWQQLLAYLIERTAYLIEIVDRLFGSHLLAEFLTTVSSATTSFNVTVAQSAGESTDEADRPGDENESARWGHQGPEATPAPPSPSSPASNLSAAHSTPVAITGTASGTAVVPPAYQPTTAVTNNPSNDAPRTTSPAGTENASVPPSPSEANTPPSLLPAAPTNTPLPAVPTNTPLPAAPTNTPLPDVPMHTPAPDVPVHTPAPGAPANTPLPAAPVHTPAPSLPATPGLPPRK